MLRSRRFNKLLIKNIIRNNSATVDQLNKQFETFQSQMKTEGNDIMELFEEFKTNYNTKMKMKKGYSHPLDEEDRPLNFCPGRHYELFYDLIGTEQVSPHYENFLFSRRWAVSITAVLGGMAYGSTILDFGWIMASSFIPFLFYATLYYFFLEGRKTMFFPLQNKWYNAIAENEIDDLKREGPGMLRDFAQEQYEKAKEQLGYLPIHQEFQAIKYESVNRFLANEQINLKNHVVNRANNLLKSAQTFEAQNKKQILSKVFQKVFSEIEKMQKNPPKSILKASFESALIGIETGKMEYEKDIVIETLLKKIKTEINNLKDLTPEQIKELISLTEMQLQQMRGQDETAKQEFLNAEPKGVDKSILQMEHMKQKMANW